MDLCSSLKLAISGVKSSMPPGLRGQGHTRFFTLDWEAPNTDEQLRRRRVLGKRKCHSSDSGKGKDDNSESDGHSMPTCATAAKAEMGDDC